MIKRVIRHSLFLAELIVRVTSAPLGRRCTAEESREEADGAPEQTANEQI